ncbi:unnamed protein product [Urochloa decumbens]|uniref:DUF1618 domain-containing protein n=1 Tax=Urochloa decumbens TaxID=240449 RepID=A0ABC9B5I5_9POAL
MKLLTRLAHCSFHRLSLSRCRPGLQSNHLVPDCRRLTESSDNPVAAATMDTGWVLLHSDDCQWNDSIVASAKTAAESRTSAGQRLRVAFELAAPPAISLLHYKCVEAARKDKYGYGLNIVATHGDTVLLRMWHRRKPSPPAGPYDHFVFRSSAAGRPPSLSLLPALKVMKKYEEGIGDPNCRPLLNEDTGILRRSDDGEFLVARIEVLLEHSEGRGVANLCMLRPGCSHWYEKRGVPIIYEEGDKVTGSSPDMAIPVGNRFVCWVVHHSGFILCDMAHDASPKLRHVHLPGTPYDPNYYTDDLPPLTDSRSMMGAAGASSLRFVAIEPRCCCGGFGRSSCPRSEYAFTVTTWTLTLTMDEPMAWVKEGVMDCEELWTLPGYEGIPRVHLQCPVVSLDNPDIVCFRVVGSMADRKAWMIRVDTRSKVLLGAVQCTTDPSKSYDSDDLRQAKFQ